MGALVSTAMVFQGRDPKYYEKLMTEARDLYSAAVARKKAYSAPFLYACAPPVQSARLSLHASDKARSAPFLCSPALLIRSLVWNDMCMGAQSEHR